MRGVALWPAMAWSATAMACRPAASFWKQTMSETVDYPKPHQDEDNRPFLEGWKEGRLMLQRSRSGGPFFFYPRPICPFTGSRDLIWVEASGQGEIVCFSLVMRPNHPAFLADVPIILAE